MAAPKNGSRYTLWGGGITAIVTVLGIFGTLTYRLANAEFEIRSQGMRISALATTVSANASDINKQEVANKNLRHPCSKSKRSSAATTSCAI